MRAVPSRCPKRNTATSSASVDVAVAGPKSRLLLATNRGSFATFLTMTIFADGFESGDTSAWSAVVP